MDLLEKMNGALTYIEENLTNDIDFKEVAMLAFCSEYHFKRMFSFLAGIPLSSHASWTDSIQTLRMHYNLWHGQPFLVFLRGQNVTSFQKTHNPDVN